MTFSRTGSNYNNKMSCIGKSLRNKKIDFSNLGQKKTLSNSSCHKCKNMIPVNEENICSGPIEITPKDKKTVGNTHLN